MTLADIAAERERLTSHRDAQVKIFEESVTRAQAHCVSHVAQLESNIEALKQHVDGALAELAKAEAVEKARSSAQ